MSTSPVSHIQDYTGYSKCEFACISIAAVHNNAGLQYCLQYSAILANPCKECRETDSYLYQCERGMMGRSGGRARLVLSVRLPYGVQVALSLWRRRRLWREGKCASAVQVKQTCNCSDLTAATMLLVYVRACWTALPMVPTNSISCSAARTPISIVLNMLM